MEKNRKEELNMKRNEENILRLNQGIYNPDWLKGTPEIGRAIKERNEKNRRDWIQSKYERKGWK